MILLDSVNSILRKAQGSFLRFNPFFFITSILLSIFTMVLITTLSAETNNAVVKLEIQKEWDLLFSEPDLERFTLCGSSNIHTARNEEMNIVGNALMNYSSSPYKTPCEELYSWAHSGEGSQKIVTEYSRYWFGTNSLTRVLLNFFELDDLRVLNFSLFFICIIYFYKNLAQVVGSKLSLFFIFFITMYLNTPALIEGFTYSVPFMLSLIFSIFLKNIYNKMENLNFYLFIFLTGMWINFFDISTTSAFLNLTIIATLTFVTLSRNNLKFFSNLLFIFSFSTLWLTGYIFNFFVKWFLALLFGDRQQVISVLVNSIKFRTGQPPDGYPNGWVPITRQTLEFTYALPMARVILLLVIVFFLFVLLLNFFNHSKLILQRIPFLMFSLTPFVFFFFAQNWSSIHPFISFRSIIYSIGFCSLVILQPPKVDSRLT